MLIDQPGVYPDITAEEYHRDCVIGGSLSSTGTRALLPPSCPALFKHRQDNPQHKQAFDLGHATHTLVLGTGAEFAVIDEPDYKKPATRAARDEAYACGKTPLLTHEREQVQAMTDAVLTHPTAGALLAPGRGHREQVFVWRDLDTGVWCRSMVDSYDEFPGVGPVIVDVKTCASAEPGAIARSVEKFGYHQQDPFYSDGYAAVFGVEPAFLFVFVEKEPPHLVTVCQINPDSRDVGRDRNRKAVDIYQRCREADRWPAYTDDVASIDLPRYALLQHQDALDRGDFVTIPQIGEAA